MTDGFIGLSLVSRMVNAGNFDGVTEKHYLAEGLLQSRILLFLSTPIFFEFKTVKLHDLLHLKLQLQVALCMNVSILFLLHSFLKACHLLINMVRG